MPISFGSSGIGGVFYGSTPIKEVYSGGTLVWSSGPSWPVTGTWSGGATGTVATVATFTIPETGFYDLSWSVTWGGSGTLAGVASWRRNGGTQQNGSGVNPAPGTSTVTASNQSFTAGDVIDFRVQSLLAGTATGGAWTVNKVG